MGGVANKPGIKHNSMYWYHTISKIINIINSLEFNIVHAFNLYSMVHVENCILLHLCFVALFQAIKVTRKGHAHVDYFLLNLEGFMQFLFFVTFLLTLFFFL